MSRSRTHDGGDMCGMRHVTSGFQYSLQGGDEKTLQVVLHPNRSLIVDMNCICWASSEVRVKPRASFYGQFVGTSDSQLGDLVPCSSSSEAEAIARGEKLAVAASIAGSAGGAGGEAGKELLLQSLWAQRRQHEKPAMCGLARVRGDRVYEVRVGDLMEQGGPVGAGAGAGARLGCISKARGGLFVARDAFLCAYEGVTDEHSVAAAAAAAAAANSTDPAGGPAAAANDANNNHNNAGGLAAAPVFDTSRAWMLHRQAPPAGPAGRAGAAANADPNGDGNANPNEDANGAFAGPQWFGTPRAHQVRNCYYVSADSPSIARHSCTVLFLQAEGSLLTHVLEESEDCIVVDAACLVAFTADCTVALNPRVSRADAGVGALGSSVTGSGCYYHVYGPGIVYMSAHTTTSRLLKAAGTVMTASGAGAAAGAGASRNFIASFAIKLLLLMVLSVITTLITSVVVTLITQGGDFGMGEAFNAAKAALKAILDEI